MSDAASITAALTAPFPSSVIEQKQGKDYIPAEYIRQRLIEATGNQFSWTQDFWEVRESDGVLRANSRTGAIPPVMVFGGTLSIPGLGERFGIGVQEMQEGAGADAAYKGAESDALKRAAMAFGCGLEQLYIRSAPIQQQSHRQQPQQEPVLFIPEAEAKAVTELIQTANSMTNAEEQRKAYEAVFQRGMKEKSMEIIELLVEHMSDPDKAQKIAKAADGKGLLSPRGIGLASDRAKQADIERKQSEAA